jgi:hypothetical protein
MDYQIGISQQKELLSNRLLSKDYSTKRITEQLITEQRLLKKLNTTKYSISVVEEIHH